MQINRAVLVAMPLLLAATAIAARTAPKARSSSGATPPEQTRCSVVIQAQKQGRFKGEDASKTKIPCVAFELETRRAGGRAQMQPLMFTKEWGAASPQLASALTSNEILTSVEFEFARPSVRGELEVYESIKLDNATLTGVKDYQATGPTTGLQQPKQLEDVSMTFQKITMEDKEAKTTWSYAMNQM